MTSNLPPMERQDPLGGCYRVLELPPGAGLEDVRAAYRALSQVWHPDRFVANADLLARANARQQELNASYRQLLEAFESGQIPAQGVGGVGALAFTADENRPGHARRGGREAAPAPPATWRERIARWSEAPLAWAPRHRLVVTLCGIVLIVGAVGLLEAVTGPAGEMRAADGSRVHAVALAVGGGHGCAASTNGLACWGRNELGQAADATAGSIDRAMTVVLPDRATALAAGLAHTCALLAGGEVNCWGGNYSGQLGDRSLQDRGTPASIAGTGRYRALTALTRHTCALTTGGDVRCWGDDTDGQLGTGAPVAACRVDELTFNCSDRPEQVGHTSSWTTVSAGGSHTCAIDRAGMAYCWGSNRYGQLGSVADNSCSGPGGAQPCARRPLAVAGLPRPVVSIAAGASHTCALDGAGRAWCWGLNTSGQAGRADTRGGPTPVQLMTDVRFRTLAAGGYHTCGVTTQRELYCWGSDAVRELRGRARDRCGDASCARAPIRLQAHGVTLVAAGFGRTCVAGQSGEVRCWGGGYSGLTPQELPPGVLGRSLNALWARVVWLGGSAHRFIDRNVVSPIRRLSQ